MNPFVMAAVLRLDGDLNATLFTHISVLLVLTRKSRQGAFDSSILEEAHARAASAAEAAAKVGRGEWVLAQVRPPRMCD